MVELVRENIINFANVIVLITAIRVLSLPVMSRPDFMSVPYGA